MKNQLNALMVGLMASVIMFSSCGNVEIVKRRHMPGYHVSINKNVKHEKPAKETAETAKADESVGSMDIRNAQIKNDIEIEPTLTASSVSTASIPSVNVSKKETISSNQKTKWNDFSSFDFKQDLAKTKNALKSSAPVGDTHWMAWVSFGTGLGASFFGLISLIVAFFAVSLWPLAILLGAAAITFAIIHKAKGYSGDRFRKLGLLFGIIGAGLGFIAMIIWIMGVAGVFGRGRYWY